MITIHIDFVTGEELSYIEGLEKGDKFATNCLTFFSNSIEADVKVVDKQGRYIIKSELMSNEDTQYTNKFMRGSHNITKMLIAGAFTWKQPGNNKLIK